MRQTDKEKGKELFEPVEKKLQEHSSPPEELPALQEYSPET
jgi:hypothetical protein